MQSRAKMNGTVVKLPVEDNVFVTANRYAVATVSLTLVFNSDFYENQEYLRNGGVV